MKRLFISVFLLILLSTVLFAAACTAENEAESAVRTAAEHVHSWSDYVVTKAAACTEAGEKTKYCDCGASISVITAPTGHSLEAGFVCSERKCINEGCTHVEPAAEHTYSVKETVPPSCTEKGYAVYVCECGEELIGDETEPAGHVFGEPETLKDADCTEDGERIKSCTVCGFEEAETVPATGHKYESNVVPATCKKGGYTEHVCVACGDSYVDSETVPLWHALDADFGCCERHCTREGCDYYEPAYKEHDYSVSSVVAPTCTEEGYTVLKCACGAVKHDDYVPPAEHAFATEAFEASCTECAYTESVCSVCGYKVRTVTAPALGHLYGTDFPCCVRECLREGCGHTEKAGSEHEYTEIVTPSTCTEKGNVATVCSVCGFVAHYEETELTAHEFAITTVNASCTEGGYTEYTCKICLYSYRDGFTEALGHLYDTGAECVDGECTREGCDHKEPASAKHDFALSSVNPSCTEKGYTEYICKYCRYYYRDDYTDALGHLYATDAECTDRECIREGCTHVEPASAEHSFTDLTVEPTCTEEGYTEHTCMTCGHSCRDDFTKALGHLYATDAECIDRACVREGCSHVEPASSQHDFVASDTSTSATCTENGYVIMVCGGCGAWYDCETEALGHDYAGGLCTRCDDMDATYDCGKLTLELRYSSYCVIGFDPSEPDTRLMMIPDEYNGIAITSIEAFALTNNTLIECVALGANFTSLDPWAFYGMASLNTLILPYGCALDGVLLPADITVITY